MEVDLILKKKDYKRNLVWFNNSNNNKKVKLTLLAKVITLHIGFIVVDVKRFSLEFIFR